MAVEAFLLLFATVWHIKEPWQNTGLGYLRPTTISCFLPLLLFGVTVTTITLLLTTDNSYFIRKKNCLKLWWLCFLHFCSSAAVTQIFYQDAFTRKMDNKFCCHNSKFSFIFLGYFKKQYFLYNIKFGKKTKNSMGMCEIYLTKYSNTNTSI